MNQCRGSVIWVTGLSGSGKTTLSSALARLFRKKGSNVILLDGDELRAVFPGTKPGAEAHGREERLRLALSYSRLSKILADQGHTVIIATISMFKEVHVWNRSNLPGYFEIYLDVPIEELRRRDPKGIYRQYDAGKIKHVAGLDMPVDEPSSPDLKLGFDPAVSPNDLALEITEQYLTRKRHD